MELINNGIIPRHKIVAFLFYFYFFHIHIFCGLILRLIKANLPDISVKL